MRLVKKTINVQQVTNVAKPIRYEDIRTTFLNKNEQYVVVEIALLDENQVIATTKRYEITGDDYNLLMSASPDFALGKPAGEFREVDLWYIIDQIEKA
ncbi:hypothetical protein [Paenibacillus sp. P22]|uniref:hypothetical protein n=1 Tax=Paenibacillus sp. P22 TaxID=483908 RepID=UPI00038F9423|nr:hypothetical protein [Paenibacillus sp. P22]CDN44187.1 Uncharacterized protein BN871_EI_00160 [Paenibacillus sp. P22]